MHFVKVRPRRSARGAPSRERGARFSFPGTLDRVESDRESRDRRALKRCLDDPEFRARYERVYAEMLEQLAPASEGPVVNPGRKRRGRLVFGDDTGEPR
jgi:hypothetical protein